MSGLCFSFRSYKQLALTINLHVNIHFQRHSELIQQPGWEEGVGMLTIAEQGGRGEMRGKEVWSGSLHSEYSGNCYCCHSWLPSLCRQPWQQQQNEKVKRSRHMALAPWEPYMGACLLPSPDRLLAQGCEKKTPWVGQGAESGAGGERWEEHHSTHPQMHCQVWAASMGGQGRCRATSVMVKTPRGWKSCILS